MEVVSILLKKRWNKKKIKHYKTQYKIFSMLYLKVVYMYVRCVNKHDSGTQVKAVIKF